MLGGLGAGVTGATAWHRVRKAPMANPSYAQQGEDLIVDKILEFIGIARPTYLDIGAFAPIVWSNTYLLYQKGCRGVLVEPNPARRGALVAERPGDVVLSVGVGSGEPGEADFFMIGNADGSAIDTFQRAQADEARRLVGEKASVKKVIKVPLVSINEIIAKHFRGAPDFLSIDTEGMDLEILRSLDFNRFRPAVVCAETLIFGPKKVETRILDLMAERGYTVRGGTHVNTIFLDDRRLP
jgi:FkbM family methyltransferase